MKNLSIVLNIVLLVAVVVLYVLYFSGNKSNNVTASGSADTAVTDLKVAYINTDTVLKYYDYFKVTRDQLETKTKQMDQDYRNRAMGWQREVDNYKTNLPNMTFAQQKATEEDLGRKQQNLQMFQQSLQQQLMVEQDKVLKDLYDRLTGYLKTYSDQRGIHMVLRFDPSSDVLYGTNAIDVTQDVINGLNEKYKADQAQTTEKK